VTAHRCAAGDPRPQVAESAPIGAPSWFSAWVKIGLVPLSGEGTSGVG